MPDDAKPIFKRCESSDRRTEQARVDSRNYLCAVKQRVLYTECIRKAEEIHLEKSCTFTGVFVKSGDCYTAYAEELPGGGHPGENDRAGSEKPH